MRSVHALMDLSDRVAIVTGGAGHIGSAICDALAENGARIVIVDSNSDSCRETAERVHRDYDADTLPLVLDLARENEVRQVQETVLQHFDSIDILVHCAALVGTSSLKGWGVPFSRQDPDTWRLALEINLTVPFVLTQACADALIRSGHGSIITIGSIYGIQGPDMHLYDGTDMGNPAAYAASKGGLLQLTRWFATVLAPHVRSNAITLGGVYRNQPESFHAQYVKKTPLQRMATEEDIKGAALYLASDLSSYVTGHNLVLDGGFTAW